MFQPVLGAHHCLSHHRCCRNHRSLCSSRIQQQTAWWRNWRPHFYLVSVQKHIKVLVFFFSLLWFSTQGPVSHSCSSTSGLLTKTMALVTSRRYTRSKRMGEGYQITQAILKRFPSLSNLWLNRPRTTFLATNKAERPSSWARQQEWGC